MSCFKSFTVLILSSRVFENLENTKGFGYMLASEQIQGNLINVLKILRMQVFTAVMKRYFSISGNLGATMDTELYLVL